MTPAFDDFEAQRQAMQFSRFGKSQQVVVVLLSEPLAGCMKFADNRIVRYLIDSHGWISINSKGVTSSGNL